MTTPDNKTLRIALILREATVLDNEYWEELLAKAGVNGEKSLADIMKSNVSLQTFKEFFTIDVIKLKTKANRVDTAEMERALGTPTQLTTAEIAAILKANQPDVARFCHILISLGLLDKTALAQALDLAEQNGLNVYEVLVGQGLVTPDVVQRAASAAGPDLGLDNRILLAGEILAFNNLVSHEGFARALESRAVTHAPLAKALEETKVLTQEDLAAALDGALDLPMVDLSAYQFTAPLAALFPADFMRRHLFVPIALRDDRIEVATSDPFNLALADTITLLTGRRCSMIYAPYQELLTRLESVGPASAASPEAGTAPAAPPVRPAPRRAPEAGSDEAAARASATRTAIAPVRDKEAFVDNLSTVQLVTQIIESALDARATDIHIEPQADGVRVRYRVDGVLHGVMKVPAEMMLSITSRIKVLASMNVTERRRPQDGHCSFETHSGSYDFRISTLPSAYGEKIVMRILDSSRVMTGLGELGLSDTQLGTLEGLIRRPYGLVLVTGPTGSGKTSTLYACLCTANTESVNILTIEDPVEYMLPGITQVQVDNNIDLTFANGLRSALRQDPDIIMVGEIRDADTSHTALRAALTGHLVFSTLHTNSAVGAISALVNMGARSYVIGSAMSGIVAQRLVRVIDETSKVAFKPPKAILDSLRISDKTKRKFWRGEPNQGNMFTGFKGRTGIFEVIEIGATMRKAIAENIPEEELVAIAREHDPGLLASGVDKIFRGITTPEEVVRAVDTV